MDNDEPGRRLEEELARRIGKGKYKRVTWPDGCKDANDALVKHGAETLRKCVENAQPYPIAGIFKVASFSDELIESYQNGEPGGALSGWPDVDELYTVRPGEWTLITGIPGHGKSEFVDAMMVNLAQSEGWKFAVYSPENQPLRLHGKKLIHKFVGEPFSDNYSKSKMSEESLR